MKASTSTALDLLRLSAALTVFLGHLAGKRFTAGLFWPLAYFMDAAVVIFFVLSGYVIAYVSDEREKGLNEYLVNRVARISSVALPALVLTFVLDACGEMLRPEMYAYGWGYSSHGKFWQYLEAFTFTNQVWWNDKPPGSMLPYWSLAYEVWYYVLFGTFWYLRGYMRAGCLALAIVIAGPKILALFPIWLLGFLAYHSSRRRVLSVTIWVFPITAGILLVLAYLLLRYHISLPPTTGMRYAVGLVCALNLIALDKVAWSPADPLRCIAQWLAGMTFSLYLIHIPVAQFLSTLVPQEPSSAIHRAYLIGATLLVVLVFAQCTERQKRWWRSSVEGIVTKVASRQSLAH